jgi:hypothetical protein
MREIVHIQAGQCGNQIGAKVCSTSIVCINEFYYKGLLAAKSVADEKRLRDDSVIKWCSINPQQSCSMN